MAGARSAIARLFRVALDRDGQAPALETTARDAGEATARGRGALPGEEPFHGRRATARVPEPATVVIEALAQKALQAWTENRHQTLFPLTVNLRGLDPRGAELLVRVAAVVLGAAGAAGAGPADRGGGVSAWLASVGADAGQLQLFARALEAPPSLAPLLREVQHADLGPYAYAVAVGCTDRRDPASRLFVEYLAARLAVPADVVRSVNRRSRA